MALDVVTSTSYSQAGKQNRSQVPSGGENKRQFCEWHSQKPNILWIIMFDYTAGDTKSKFYISAKDESGNIITLSGATVTLRWKNQAGALVSQTMTVTDAANGLAEYQFAAGELFAPSMAFEVQIVDGAGKILSSVENIQVAVKKKIA